MRNFLFSIFVALLYTSFLSAQVPQATLTDILEFKVDTTRQKLYGWLTASFTGKIRTRIENDTLENGKRALILNSPDTEKAKSSYCLATGFLMPTIHHLHEMEASFSCKNQGFDSVQLVFMGYNTDGKRVSVDTLKIGITDDWHEFTTTVHIGNVSYMHRSLEVEGNIPNIEKTLWINKIQLRINGIDLAQYPSRSLGKEHTLDEKEIVKLSFEDSTTYKQIQSLANKRIVALGESIHGSETLEKSAIQIMKYRIMHSNCKLILLELPLEKTLIMNRFVQSDERFEQ